MKQNFSLNTKKFIQSLKQEKNNRNNGGIYHYMQVHFAYNSNRMEGSMLTKDQTRHIFEIGQFVAEKDAVVRSNDIIETINHFRIFDHVIETYEEKISPEYIKGIHYILKSGIIITDATREIIGDFKNKANFVGGEKTTRPKEVEKSIIRMINEYTKNLNASKNIDEKLEIIIDMHYDFEKIHPFYDGNGRVGRILLFKECLKNNIVPFIIEDEKKAFYLRGLKEYKNMKGYLIDTCLDGQDHLIRVLKELDIATTILLNV